MKIAMIGLGKMGGNMSRRLLRNGHQVVGYNRSPEAAKSLAEEEGLEPAFSLEEAVGKLPSPRIAWVMVPAGGPTESVIEDLSDLLQEGDIIVDGGNSNYQDTLRRGEELAE